MFPVSSTVNGLFRVLSGFSVLPISGPAFKAQQSMVKEPTARSWLKAACEVGQLRYHRQSAAGRLGQG